VDHSRLSMPVGEAMFTQRAIRRFRPDPIPIDDLHLLVEAAVRAPNGGNQQVARFLLVTNRAMIGEFAPIYRDAWWAKRHDEGLKDYANLPERYHPAARLADEIASTPCIAFALAVDNGPANSVIPAVQNLMLAARSLGIGSVPTTLHPSVMERFRALFGIPETVRFHLCVPLGYPQGHFGPNQRQPTSQTTFFERWEAAAPWA
jgi:nitroreductase